MTEQRTLIISQSLWRPRTSPSWSSRPASCRGRAATWKSVKNWSCQSSSSSSGRTFAWPSRSCNLPASAETWRREWSLIWTESLRVKVSINLGADVNRFGDYLCKDCVNFDSVNSGLGSILDTVSKDTAHSFILSVSKIQFSQLLLIISVSKYQKDTEDTASHVSVS